MPEPLKRSMTLTLVSRENGMRDVGSLVRSFDNARAAGNFAVCRVRVNGHRFSYISCEHDLWVYPTHPATCDCCAEPVKFYDACEAALAKQNARIVANAERARRANAPKFNLYRVHIDRQGYADAGMAYRGIGAPLYRYCSEDMEIEGEIRANDRDHAKQLIQAAYKYARFYA